MCDGVQPMTGSLPPGHPARNRSPKGKVIGAYLGIFWLIFALFVTPIMLPVGSKQESYENGRAMVVRALCIWFAFLGRKTATRRAMRRGTGPTYLAILCWGFICAFAGGLVVSYLDRDPRGTPAQTDPSMVAWVAAVGAAIIVACWTVVQRHKRASPPEADKDRTAP